MKAALLFPGEQNHAVGMLQNVRRKPVVRRMLEAATQVFGFDVEELMLEGPAADMVAPGVNLPLMYVAGCAAFEVLRETNAELADNCQAAAGFGVGEYVALYAAEVITYEQGLALVKSCAEALQDLAGQVEAEALSVRGLDPDTVERLLRMVLKSGGGDAEARVHISRYLCPGGVVCAGRRDQVEKLRELVLREAAGAEVDVRYLGNLASHTPLAQAACTRLAGTLDKLLPAMRPPKCDLYLNTTGSRLPAGRLPETFAGDLKARLAAPIQWERCITQMLVWGIREFYECGPNRSLRFMMSFYEHFIEAPLEVVRPAEFTYSICV